MPTETAGSKPPNTVQPQQHRTTHSVNTVTAADIRASLKAGLSDFLSRPVMSGFFGLFYALFGIMIVWCLV